MYKKYFKTLFFFFFNIYELKDIICEMIIFIQSILVDLERETKDVY